MNIIIHLHACVHAEKHDTHTHTHTHKHTHTHTHTYTYTHKHTNKITMTCERLQVMNHALVHGGGGNVLSCKL